MASCGPGGWRKAVAPDVTGLPGELAPSARCVLGHNWLAIMDRSAAAAQPMIRGSAGIVFNGEIYNYLELRDARMALDTESDTEVLLRIWERGEVERLRGMFAFLVYDAATETMWAVRDPYGIKPLYWAETGAGVLVASEIRALHVEGGVPRRMRESAVIACAAAGINEFGATRTLYEGVNEVPPGHLLRVSREGIELRRWHTFPALTGDSSDAAELRRTLEESVRIHLRGTRKIAACLSGGLDSSSIVTLIGRHLAELKQPFAAYSVFSGSVEDNEVPLARQVCSSSKIDHRVIEFQGTIPALDAIEMTVAYETPNHVIGPVNQFLLLRRIAADGATVVLDGQGGDELVSAYVWYVPVLLKRMAESGFDLTPLREQMAVRLPMPPDRLRMFESMFHSPEAWLRAFIWDTDFLGLSHELVGELEETKYYLAGGGEWSDFREAMYLRRELHYLLRQEDRLGMWFGLECRVPFVDDPLVRAAARLRPEYLLKDGYLKYPYREMMTDLPDEVRWNVTKRGFWETHESRFPWMDDVSRGLCWGSDVLRRCFPKLEEKWGWMSFDQKWRLLQVAVLERISERGGIVDLDLG